MLKYIITAIIAYFIGNFSSAMFYSKIFKHEDVRTKGSGNAGAANMLRNYGLRMGLATFFTDFLKGVLAIVLGRLIGGDICGYVAGVAVLIGHNWPVLYKFKGGKGVSASIGVIFMINWQMTLIIFAICIGIIFLTGYVSAASIFGLGIAPFVIMALNWGDLPMIITVAIISAIVVISHRGNIQRLIKGEEKKVSFKRGGESKR
ncbi:MAG: glycerol-3-phosphate 1-O-acyltransferase PlsY [Clostridia bacterium]|nr:glycerol-3-phosphate 1-O-acyltransferase PlsY [Clostridia bacterium]